LASDDIREAEQRLAAALERIADMADQGLTRAPAPPPPDPERPVPATAEIVARLDALIERLRDALARDSFGQ
jgi:hypothetical protein